MSLINKYLVETTLTSTKNKILDDDQQTTKNKILEDDQQTHGVKRFEPQWMKENVCEPKSKRRTLPFRRNLGEKFLKRGLKMQLKEVKKYGAAFFKKKRKCRTGAVYAETYSSSDHSLERDRSRSLGRDRSISKDENSYLCEEMDTVSLRMNILSAEQEASSVDPISHDGVLAKLQEFRQGPPQGSYALFGNNSLPCATTASFGSDMPCSASSAFTFGGVSFPQANVANLRALPRKFRSDVLDSVICDKIIMEMPTYKLDVAELHEVSVHEGFQFSSDDPRENSIVNQKAKKMQLLNVVSMALMYSPNLKNEHDNYRQILLTSANAVKIIDPEFILKVALYARQELQIRAVTNFLLSYAAFHKNTRIYLEKYFEASVVLPTDWIQVAEYYQILNIGENQPFPAALRRIMKKTFSKFDEYQLAKYKNANSQKKEKKKKKKGAKDKEEDSMDISEDDQVQSKIKEISQKMTLKHLIRRLHIDSPAEHVMGLLGKMYPGSHEEFKKSGLSGSWDPSKAGIRMKLPIPETWETQISANGNNPSVWESLIDNKKLPYMAMLRNLRNLITSNISPAHHMKATKYLKNVNAVIKSRQLPIQYFEAYKAITHLQGMLEKKRDGRTTIYFRTSYS